MRMNHVTVQMSDGTTQIDHILVSRFGVFVIETKDYKGWLFANADDYYWTQVLFRRKYRFQNLPFQEHDIHVRAKFRVCSTSYYRCEAVKSVVVLTGDAGVQNRRFRFGWSPLANLPTQPGSAKRRW